MPSEKKRRKDRNSKSFKEQQIVVDYLLENPEEMKKKGNQIKKENPDFPDRRTVDKIQDYIKYVRDELKRDSIKIEGRNLEQIQKKMRLLKSAEWSNCAASDIQDYIIERMVPYKNPDEDGVEEYYEGKKIKVSVNKYERDRFARNKCIEIWGCKCYACQCDFGKEYGDELGKDFIHVHHLIPLSEIGGEYKVNPEEDLRPLCPNCHAMVHRIIPPHRENIEKLKEIWEEKHPKSP